MNFHMNEAPLDPPQCVVRAVQSIEARALRTYPVERAARLVQTLAARTGVSTEHVALGNGADELLLGLGRAFLAPGDDALFAAPSFAIYETSTRLAGGVPRVLRYATRWRFDPQAFIALATPRTRLAFIGSPNNPTGEMLDEGSLIAIAEALPFATIVIDEVYTALSERSLLDVATRYDNVIALGSFSKSAGLAGMRVGYAIAAPRRADALRRSIGPYSVAAASLIAVQAYLDNPTEIASYQSRLRTAIERSLDAIVAAFHPFARDCWRGPANFALIDLGDAMDAVVAALSARGIVVRRFDDPELRTMIRVCAGDEVSTRAFVEALTSLNPEYARA